MPAYCKLVLQLFVLVTATLAFSPSRQGRVSQIGSTSVPTARVLRWPVLLATPEEESASEAAPAVTQVSTPPPVAQEPEGTSYPLDIPSPILLSFSMILAIVGTGKKPRRSFFLSFINCGIDSSKLSPFHSGLGSFVQHYRVFVRPIWRLSNLGVCSNSSHCSRHNSPMPVSILC